MVCLEDHIQRSRLTALSPRLYATTEMACFPQASYLHVNAHLLTQLGLDEQMFASNDCLTLFTGMRSSAQLQPISTVYAGHQFGIYTSQLGDGRVHILGDVVARDGASWEMQLKGAGATPFARGNSGRMSLAEAITEYLGSEAMAGLGIATTRGLALIQHSRDNDQSAECILLRTASSHLRFGHFEYLHNQGERSLLKDLVDHVIAEHYPELSDIAEADRYLQFLFSVTRRTAQLLAHWQAVGFVHSVMNTDNMSILGLTLDYGVYGFMQTYDPAYSPNANDDQNRYAFDQQVEVARWNCLALGEALLELLPGKRIPATLLRQYRQTYTGTWLGLMRRKLGLLHAHAEDGKLIAELLQLLHQHQVDYTRFFRRFSYVDCFGEEVMGGLISTWGTAFKPWFEAYRQRLTLESVSAQERVATMLAHNPLYILRQDLLEQAIMRVEQQRDFGLLQHLLFALKTPYTENAKYEFLT